jgi:serine/threonine-protein kinase
VQLQRTPDDVTLVSRMSLYSARVGAAGESIALLKRAVQLAPSDAYVHFRAGLAYELLGHRAAALAEIAAARSRGYPASKIEAEPDLVSLRHDARYQPPPTEE